MPEITMYLTLYHIKAKKKILFVKIDEILENYFCKKCFEFMYLYIL